MDEQHKGTPHEAGAAAQGGHGPAEGYLRMFAESGNLLYLWGALRSCRANGLPLPDEVLAYLDRVARALLRLAERTPKTPPRVAPALQLALGFQGGKGSGSEFSDYRKRLNDLAMAIDIHVARYGAQGAGAKKAAAQIALAHDVSVRTVERALGLQAGGGTAGPGRRRPKRPT